MEQFTDLCGDVLVEIFFLLEQCGITAVRKAYPNLFTETIGKSLLLKTYNSSIYNLILEFNAKCQYSYNYVDIYIGLYQFKRFINDYHIDGIFFNNHHTDNLLSRLSKYFIISNNINIISSNIITNHSNLNYHSIPRPGITLVDWSKESNLIKPILGYILMYLNFPNDLNKLKDGYHEDLLSLFINTIIIIDIQNIQEKFYPSYRMLQSLVDDPELLNLKSLLSNYPELLYLLN